MHLRDFGLYNQPSTVSVLDGELPNNIANNAMLRKLYVKFNYFESACVMFVANFPLSLVIWSPLVLRSAKMSLGDDSQDHHVLNTSLTQVVIHSSISLVESPLPSVPPILGTTKCIGKKRCNWYSLKKESRRGKNEQVGSVKTLVGNSDSKVVVNIDEPHKGWSCLSAKVAQVAKSGSYAPSTDKPPDCYLCIHYLTRSYLICMRAPLL